MKPKRSTGRPPILEEDRRTRKIVLRVNEEEAADINELRVRDGDNETASWVRRELIGHIRKRLGKPSPPAPKRKVVR